jgi:hypothetical protein
VSAPPTRLQVSSSPTVAAPDQSTVATKTVATKTEYRFDDPSRDTDGDGVADPSDKCPQHPGPADQTNRHPGCPIPVYDRGVSPLGVLAQLPEGSSSIEKADNYQQLLSITEGIRQSTLCARIHTFVEQPNATTAESLARLRLGETRAAASRRLLLKRGFEAKRIISVANDDPSDLVARGVPREKIRNMVYIEPTACPQEQP